ncbi:MAG: histidine phosphatase family protein [Anaerolineae bacterium]|nr:histidine phosphatase family protein [Anaerolineae bacterium]
MKTLLLLRHAKSSWKHEGVPDHDRPLKKRGQRIAPKIGHLLVDQDLVPQLIVSSTAKRARKTARYVADACGYTGEIVLEHGLYQAGPMGHVRILQEVEDVYQRIMIVGHNPGLEVLLEVLTGKSEWLPTAALAHIELPINSWADVREYVGGELVNLWLPKELKKT